VDAEDAQVAFSGSAAPRVGRASRQSAQIHGSMAFLPASMLGLGSTKANLIPMNSS